MNPYHFLLLILYFKNKLKAEKVYESIIRTTTMERSNTHPITDYEEEPFDIEYDCPICGINRGKHDVSKRNYLIPCESDGEDDEEEEEEDDWEDITHCHLTYTKKNNTVSTKLQMAGGGSHAWWYVLYWKSSEEQPEVYIETLNEVTHTKKTLIVRQEQWGQSVKLVDFCTELPRNNDEYHYHCFTITDDLYDATEEEDEYEPCGHCDKLLSTNDWDTTIMVTITDGEETCYCHNCYWNNEYWRDDQNEDNEDEIKEYIFEQLRDDPNFVS